MIPTAPLFSQRILLLVEAGNHHLLTHSTTVYSEIKKKNQCCLRIHVSCELVIYQSYLWGTFCLVSTALKLFKTKAYCGFSMYIFFKSLIAQLEKNPPAMQETLVQFLGWEDPLEKGKVTNSSILGWGIPWIV